MLWQEAIVMCFAVVELGQGSITCQKVSRNSTDKGFKNIAHSCKLAGTPVLLAVLYHLQGRHISFVECKVYLKLHNRALLFPVNIIIVCERKSEISRSCVSIRYYMPSTTEHCCITALLQPLTVTPEPEQEHRWPCSCCGCDRPL